MEKNGFQDLELLGEARKKFLNKVDEVDRKESLGIEKTDNRVISKKIISPKPIPTYNRAAMDGFAVKASNTFGATKSSPVVLDLDEDPKNGGACEVHTGSAIPDGSDAVVKIEDVEISLDKLEVFNAVSPGENVDFVGDDIEEGDVVFDKNHRLRPFDVGLLRSFKINEIEVYEKPSVLVVPTGDEVVSFDEEPGAGEVIESNSVVVDLLCKRYGANSQVNDILGDDKQELINGLKKGKEYDVIVFIGGTSVGKRDYTASLVKKHGEVFSHGIAIKPGKPTLLGRYKDTMVICLPGHPVACFIACILFLRPLLEKLSKRRFYEKKIDGVLDRKIESTVGYRTFTRVNLEDGFVVPVRTSGSGIQSSLTSADGYVVIPEQKEGIEKGKEVEVVLFE